MDFLLFSVSPLFFKGIGDRVWEDLTNRGKGLCVWSRDRDLEWFQLFYRHFLSWGM